jgi:hypothetical protein
MYLDGAVVGRLLQITASFQCDAEWSEVGA